MSKTYTLGRPPNKLSDRLRRKCKFQNSLVCDKFLNSYDNCSDYSLYVAVFTRGYEITCQEKYGKHNDCYHFVCHCLRRPPNKEWDVKIKVLPLKMEDESSSMREHLYFSLYFISVSNS